MSEKIKKPEASPQDVKDLYDQTVKLFEELQDRVVVKPAGDGSGRIVTEVLDIPLIDNKHARLYRIRRGNSGNPSKVAADAPLERFDERGELHETPVGIDVFDNGTPVHSFTVYNEVTPSGSEQVDAQAVDFIDGKPEAIKALDAKELIAQFEQAMDDC